MYKAKTTITVWHKNTDGLDLMITAIQDALLELEQDDYYLTDNEIGLYEITQTAWEYDEEREDD
jgi:hypothetical protein|tara:strand:- start:127 stop:318 length:192 start_codon:yes stop_codon:yes gene_type:complete